MEYLTRFLNKVTENGFSFHRKCEEIKLSHLCFADDLFVLANGDGNSVEKIKEALDHFEEVSGLVPNMQKSEVFFSGVEHPVKLKILGILGFKEGALPIKYLGLPLISSRLTRLHCQELVSKITTRISTWTVRTLSYAGRLQLIKSVLASLHVFWCSIFILPMAVINEVKKLCKYFLWHGSGETRRGGLVSWEVVCQQKSEGGLGVKPMHLWNQALQIKHI